MTAEQEAIQEDVSGFGADRLAKINAIAASTREESGDDEGADVLEQMKARADEINKELASYQEDPETGEFEQAEEEDESGEEENEESHDELPQPTERMLRVKVDGVDQELPESKAIAIIQKNMAADRRLEEAARREREISERERMLSEKEQQQLSAKDVAKQESSEELKTLAQRYHEALLDGEDQTANELFLELQSRRSTAPTIDKDALAQQIYQDLERRQKQERYQSEINEAQAFFKSQFSDIANDQQLYDIADRYTVEVMNENPGLSPKEVVTEAGRRTQQWVAKLGVKGEQRVDAKRNLSGMTGTNARRAGKPEIKPKTRAETIAEMRMARGK